MPEGIEGYQPSAAELKIGQENLEAMGVTEEPTERGTQHVDAQGNIIDRTETWETAAGPEQQTIQFTYLDDGVGAIENGKITAGEKAGWELRREHPMLPCAVDLQWYDEDLETTIAIRAPALLENLGQTLKGGDSREPYAQFIVTDPDALQAFADFKRQPGEAFAKKEGNFGGGFSLTINRREVTFDRIDKISVNFENEWPSRATLHCYNWRERVIEEQ